MNPTPLHYQTIAEVADRIAAKELSPVDLTTAMLDRIDQLEGQLKCYATLMADEAMASARLAVEEISTGKFRGPLHGCPIAIKDLCFT